MHHQKQTFTSPRIERIKAQRKQQARRARLEKVATVAGVLLFIACILTAGAIDTEAMLYLK